MSQSVDRLNPMPELTAAAMPDLAFWEMTRAAAISV